MGARDFNGECSGFVQSATVFLQICVEYLGPGFGSLIVLVGFFEISGQCPEFCFNFFLLRAQFLKIGTERVVLRFKLRIRF